MGGGGDLGGSGGGLGWGRGGTQSREKGGLGMTPVREPRFWKPRILMVFALSPKSRTCPRHFHDLTPALRLPFLPGQ